MSSLSRWTLAASICIAVAALVLAGDSLAQGEDAPQAREQPQVADMAATDDSTTTGTSAPSTLELTVYDHVRNVLFAVTVVLALVGIVALAWGVYLLVKAMIDTVNDRGEVVAVYSNWGGFGGSLGGWSLSRALSLLLGATLLAVIAVGLTNVVLKSVDPQRKDKLEEPEGNGSAPAQTGESAAQTGQMKMKKATGNEKEPKPEDLPNTD